MHDPRLLDDLSKLTAFKLDSDVYRAVRKGLDPLTPSTAGGRWSPRGSVPVLYTSLTREGSLAEVSFHWSLLDPLPTRPVAIHRIRAITNQTIRLVEVDLVKLGASVSHLGDVPYQLTQDIGAAVAFLGHDGLIIPSARWKTENLVLFAENSPLESELKLLDSEEIDWQAWARAAGLLS